MQRLQPRTKYTIVVIIALVCMILLYYAMQPSRYEESNIFFTQQPLSAKELYYKVYTGEVRMSGVHTIALHDDCHNDDKCYGDSVVTRYDNALELILNMGEMGLYTASDCNVKVVQSRPSSNYVNRIGNVCEPWINRNAIQLLDRLLDTRMESLEWGSGTGTIWTLPRVKTLTSIEHNEQWFNNILNTISKKFSQRITNRWIGKFVPFSDNENKNYAKIPFIKSSKKFDYINVDGRDRVECFKRAMELIRPYGGILMLDNSERERYRPIFNMVPKHWRKAQFTFPGVSQTTIWITSPE
jgi:hypothetical protein